MSKTKGRPENDSGVPPSFSRDNMTSDYVSDPESDPEAHDGGKPRSLGLKLFDEPHVAEMLIFIYHNPGCKKTDVYRNVARGDRMHKKLEILEEQGIIALSTGGRRVTMELTSLGRSIVLHLICIQDILRTAR